MDSSSDLGKDNECYCIASCFNIQMALLQIGTSTQSNNPSLIMDRTQLATKDVVAQLWDYLKLPSSVLESLLLPGTGLGAPLSFKLGILAQASIGLSALSAALVYSHVNNTAVPKVEVPLQHAVVEFDPSSFLTIDGKPLSSARTPIGGLHKTADGHICIHDGILVHREAPKIFLGCSGENYWDKIARAVAQWTTIDFETTATEAGLAVATLRLFEQWDHHPQAQAISDFPITIRKISDSPPSQDTNLKPGSDKCLRGLRVIEMTRVIARPVAGKTLAADVLWITSPKLEDQPSLDRDFARGERTVCLDVDVPEDRARLDELPSDADSLLQSYRPGSLASKGLSPEDLAARLNNGIICANLSAYGPIGPWSMRRGFGSRVQMCPVGC